MIVLRSVQGDAPLFFVNVYYLLAGLIWYILLFMNISRRNPCNEKTNK